MTDSPATSLVARFCIVWAESFASVLASLGTASPSATAAEPVAAATLSPEEIDKTISIRFSGGGALRGELLWVAEKPVALRLAQLLMSEPADPAVQFSDMHRDAFAEFLRQVAGHAATAWKQETGAETEINFQSAAVPALTHAQSSSVRLTGEQLPELSLRLLLNEELCNSLSAPPAAQPAVPEKPARPPAAQPEPESEPVLEPDLPPVASGSPLPANLELVLDVELEATIRFGDREMLLRDIFGLMPGGVVELNQMVNAPAELLVAGRLVARGEVVVVDGNFGLRVTEVASVNQRAAALQF
jgi:flagellar motor switch protein FliN/FliY